MLTSSSFQPDWTSAPGDTIAEALEERGITLEDFARSTNLTLDDAKALIEGRQSITVAVARQLQRFIGGSVEFWMSRDFQYREDSTRIHIEDRGWLDDLPIGDMIRFGWLGPRPTAAEELAACLRFFGVRSVHEWRRQYSGLAEAAAFRTSPSFDSRVGAVAAWLQRGTIEAAAIKCETWNASSFRTSLSAARALTKLRTPGRFLPRLQDLCSHSGVAVVVVRAPNGCRASGATHFLSTDKALLQLSFRYLTDDQFWFTFFHEAGHLLLHEGHLKGGRGGDAWILEGSGDERSSEEDEASRFAEEILFPGEFRKALATLPGNVQAVVRFAVRAGISPGIVVGQLQHRGLGFDQLNALKRRYVWR
jgi:HTH-type transcriptional regulator / antitoxin HigA